VLECFKEGYEYGVTRKEWVQPEELGMWIDNEEGDDKDGDEKSFFLKRVQELREAQVPIIDDHPELLRKYLEKIGELDLLEKFELAAVGDTFNAHSRRRRVILMLTPKDSKGEVDDRALLFDFKPVITEHGNHKYFINPCPSNNGERMLLASNLYAPDHGLRESWVEWQGKEYCCREIPKWKNRSRS